MGVWWMVLSHESQEQSERELLGSMRHLELTRKSLVESEKLASLGGLVAGVAHEINTPVGMAVSTASFLSDRTEAAQALVRGGGFDAVAQARYLRDAAEAARLLLSNAKRVAQLVLNFKQLAVDRISEPRRTFDLRERVAQALHELLPRLDESGVEVVLEIAPGIAMDSYPDSLAQVVTNLAVNTMQHAFEPGQGGCITVSAGLREDDELQLELRDNGRGIEPALQGRVFEPFFTTSRMRGGSGLGLYIVHQIVTRQLGGSIELLAGASSGARFVMRFPRVVRHAPDVGRILATLPRSAHDDA
jgi:signal transduction histidine kinase